MLEQPIAAGQKPENERSADQNPARVELRELLAVLGLIVVADFTIYRGHGFAGAAGMLVAAPALLLLGAPHRRMTVALGLIEVLLLLLAAALAWCGTLG